MFGQLNCAPTLCIIQIKPKYLFEAVESLDSARLKAMLLLRKESVNQELETYLEPHSVFPKWSLAGQVWGYTGSSHNTRKEYLWKEVIYVIATPVRRKKQTRLRG